jgi:hypothetical protein
MEKGGSMTAKKGTVLPKKGTSLHLAEAEGDPELNYAAAVAAALRRELGATHQAIKATMRWTGASERTVKYWFAGTKGPNGVHLISLARHSDVILELFLRQAGRQRHVRRLRLIEAHDKLCELLEAIQAILREDADSG